MTLDQNNNKALLRARLKKPVTLKQSEYNQLSSKDQKRYDKLTGILAKLKAKETVYTSDLKRWLDDAYEGIAATWEQEKDIYRQLSDIPDVLKDYGDRIKKALFYQSRSDFYGRRGKREAAFKMGGLAESEFQDALTNLEEILSANPEYVMYLDRFVSFEAGSEIGTNCIDIPRLITSRSLDRQGRGMLQAKRSKQEIKIEVVENVLSDIVESVRMRDVEKSSGHSTKLEKLLNNIDNEYDF